MSDSIITLGGRRFRPVAQGSVLNDCWVMGRLRLCGLDGVPAPGESIEAYAERVLATLMASNQLLELAGGMLVPADVGDEAWSEAMARATAAFIGGLREPEDKLQMRAFTLMVVIPFLESGLASRRSSIGSSPPAPGESSLVTACGPATTSESGAP